jgi:hypothetical protein
MLAMDNFVLRPPGPKRIEMRVAQDLNPLANEMAIPRREG